MGTHNAQQTTIIHNGRKLTYRELASRSLAMIGYLQTQRLQRGGTAVIVVPSLLSSWIAVIALRALGINTITADSLQHIGRLGMQDSAYVIVEEADKADQIHLSPGRD